MNITLAEIKQLIGQLRIENFILQKENEQLKEALRVSVKAQQNEKVNPDGVVDSDGMGTASQHVKEPEQT